MSVHHVMAWFLAGTLVLLNGGCEGGGGRVAEAPAEGSATLTWRSPLNKSGLMGYYIYYGTSRTSLSRKIKVPDPTATSYTVTSLPPGTYYFKVTAYDGSGAESPATETLSKTIE